MGQIHYHVDEFEVVSGEFFFVRDSVAMPKRSALREFERRVAELARQVGRFVVHRQCDERFPGAIRVAINHRIALAVTRCDCDGGEQ